MIANGPLRPLWTFRALLAAWTVAYLGARAPYLRELYCRPVLREDVTAWLGWPPPPLPLVQALVALAIAAAVAVGVGWRARAAWSVLFPVFALLFALDPMSARGYGTLALVQWGLLGATPLERPREADGPLWSGRLLLAQWSSVYVLTIPAKLVEPGWWTGDALWLALRHPEFGRFLLSAGGVSHPVAAALGWAALALEALIGVGVWFDRTRRAAVVACLALHAGILLSMRISPLFALLMWAHLPLVTVSRRAPPPGT